MVEKRLPQEKTKEVARTSGISPVRFERKISKTSDGERRRGCDGRNNANRDKP